MQLPTELLELILEWALALDANRCCLGRHSKPSFDLIRGFTAATTRFRQVALAKWFRVFRIRHFADWHTACRIDGFWQWVLVIVYIEKTLEVPGPVRVRTLTTGSVFTAFGKPLLPIGLTQPATKAMMKKIHTVSIITHRPQASPPQSAIGSILWPVAASFPASEIVETFPYHVHRLELTYNFPAEEITILKELSSTFFNITVLKLICSTIFTNLCDPGPSIRFFWRSMIIPHSFSRGRDYGEFLAPQIASLRKLAVLVIDGYLTDYAAIHHCEEHRNWIPSNYTNSHECLVCRREYHKATYAEEQGAISAIVEHAGMPRLKKIGFVSWFEGSRPADPSKHRQQYHQYAITYVNNQPIVEFLEATRPMVGFPEEIDIE